LALKYCQGTKQQSYTAKIVKQLPIVLPPLAEQKRIAEALSDVDELIASLEKLIEKKKALKQGVMQELLTGKRRLPGFSGEWESVNLEQIGVLSGSGVDKKVLPDEKPITLLNYTNVYHQTAISRKDLSHQVTASDKKISECNVRKYDVFLTPTSETPDEIAFSAVAVEDMPDVVYSYHIVRLRPYDSFNGAYINYAMNTEMFRNQATMLAEGSGIRYVITLKKFKDMVVMVPCDLNEQNAIVQVLFDFEKEIEKLSQKLIKARQIKSGMMSELLTGRIRLLDEKT
jgi:type I restriction enzyme S subunit